MNWIFWTAKTCLLKVFHLKLQTKNLINISDQFFFNLKHFLTHLNGGAAHNLYRKSQKNYCQDNSFTITRFVPLISGVGENVTENMPLPLGFGKGKTSTEKSAIQTRGQIIDLWKTGKSASEISRTLGCKYDTARLWIER